MGRQKIHPCRGFSIASDRLTAGPLAITLLAITLLTGCGEPDATTPPVAEQSSAEVSPQSKTPTASIPDRKVWDITYIKGKRVGYGWTSLSSQTQNEENVLKIEGYSLLSLKRFGEANRLETRFVSTATPDGALLEFQSEMPEGAQPVKSSGRVTGDTLELTVTSQGKPVTRKIPWRKECGGPYAVELSLLTKPMVPGEKRSIDHFDVAIGLPATTTMLARDYQDVEILGAKKELLQIDATTDFAVQKIETKIWADRTGEILRTRTSAMGLDLEVVRATEAEALAGSGNFSFDLGRDVMIAVDRPLADPHATRRIVYRLTLKDGNPAETFPSGHSQSIEPVDEKTARLTVWALRPDSDWGNSHAADDPSTDDDRDPNALVQSDDPLVVKMSEEAVGDERDPFKAATAIESYVSRHMTKSGFTTAFASAAEVAKTGKGDCTEHAVLLAAMARAAKIPARVAMGLVYYQKAYAYHMWTEVHIDGRWIPLDATLGKGGIGAAHLKVAHSNLKSASPYVGFLPVLKIIGNLKIEIEEVE